MGKEERREFWGDLELPEMLRRHQFWHEEVPDMIKAIAGVLLICGVLFFIGGGATNSSGTDYCFIDLYGSCE